MPGQSSFPKMEIPQNGWFIVENPSINGCLGGTPILGNLQLVLEEMSEEDEETYGQHLRFGLAMDGVGLWMVLNTCHGH